ncbi:outer membrane protein OmpU [Palleronia marisminoris]|uniref:Porin n=1 Tax=Palleronia marisminoris TaxID=315423 RepID=A0A1Y5SLM9_9RHOB|nr:porin [Palleronia marisminoris]SFG87254.1 outer membrane protein OmpU [Palleronia marisminoris]SLN43050.1 Porin [Palleronia marisminoris]
MEKFLLASTALVASTTFAFAEVNVSGTAEMGVFGASSDIFADEDENDGDLQFHTDVDVIFTMAGETDAGLAFGAEVDLDDVININRDDEGDDDGVIFPATGDDSDDGGIVIFVDGAYGRLTMGDTDGGFDWALEEAIIGGSLRDDHEHAGYNGNAGLDGTYDGQIARYEYAFGDFGVAASAELDDDDDGDGDDPILGLGARYNGEFAGVTFGAGLGYQTGADVADDGESADGSIVGASLSAKMDNGIQGIINYSHYDDDLGGDYDHLGLAIGYEWDAFLIAANYGTFDYDDGEDEDGYGVVVNYDLGGGAQLQAGYGHSDDGDDDFSTYSFGIAMAF